VISLGCDISALAPRALVEHWDDVPPPSTQLHAARDCIYAHVERLIDELGKLETESHRALPGGDR
jgi:hypothetical protein